MAVETPKGTLAAAVKEGLKCRFVIEGRAPGSFRKDT